MILIGAYGGSLIYAFTAQRDLFRPDARSEHDAVRRSSTGRGDRACSPSARC